MGIANDITQQECCVCKKNWGEKIMIQLKNKNKPVENNNDPVKNKNDPVKNNNDPVKNNNEPVKNNNDLV